jgi:hypothetical protein
MLNLWSEEVSLNNVPQIDAAFTLVGGFYSNEHVSEVKNRRDRSTTTVFLCPFLHDKPTDIAR